MALHKLGRLSRRLSHIFRRSFAENLQLTTIFPKLPHSDAEAGFTTLVAVGKTCSQVWLSLFLAAESLRQQVPKQVHGFQVLPWLWEFCGTGQ